MEFKLTEMQEMIRDLAKSFAKDGLTNRIDEIESEENVGHFPADIYRQMCDSGFMGITFGEEYGGINAGYESFVLAFEELSKISPSAATALGISLVPMEAIHMFGSKEQKDAYIPDGITGKSKGSMAFTEPGTGSDPKQLTTTARLEGDTWIINGVKRFISNAQYEGPILLYAKEAETGACTAFIVDKFCEGYSISTPWDKVGLKGSAVYDVFLDDVKVPNDAFHILGQRGEGFSILKRAAAYGKLGFCAIFLGALGGVMDRAKSYITTKTHRDGVITKFQAVQMKFADLMVTYETCRLLVYKAGALANEHDSAEFPAYIALAKSYVGDNAIQGCLMAMNLLGSYGVMQEYRIENFLRDCLIGPHVEGQTDVQRIIAATYYAAHEFS